MDRNSLAIVTKKELADTVFRILGPIASRFFDMDGHEITGVRAYKTTGFPVGEDRYLKLAALAKEQAKIRRETGYRQKTTASFAIDPEVKEWLKASSKEAGMSMSAYGERLLRQAMEKSK